MAPRRTKKKAGADLPARVPSEGDLLLTKQEVVERELNAAVKIYAAGGDPVAVHVLVSAATEILGAVARANGARTMRGLFIDRVKPEFKSAISGALVESFNFMKHGQSDADATLVFDPREAEMALFFACTDFNSVYRAASAETNLFLAHFLEMYPELLREDAADPFVAIRTNAHDLVQFEEFNLAALQLVLEVVDRVQRIHGQQGIMAV